MWGVEQGAEGGRLAGRRGAGLSSKPIQVLRMETAATGAAVESTRKASFSRLTPHASASGRRVGPTMRIDE